MKSPEIKELVSSDELIKYNLEMVFYLYLDFYISYFFQIVIFFVYIEHLQWFNIYVAILELYIEKAKLTALSVKCLVLLRKNLKFS